MNRNRLTINQKTSILLNFYRMSYGRLSQVLAIPRSSISSFIYRTRITGSIENRKSRGRTKYIDNRMSRKIQSFIRKFPDTTLFELKNKLGLTCSLQTIRKCLKKSKINYYNKSKKIKLNGSDKLLRIEFARNNLNLNFTRLVFTDTTSIEEYFSYKKRNWRVRGIIDPNKHYDRRSKTYIKKYIKFFCWIMFNGQRNITATKRWNASEFVKILDESFKDINLTGKIVIMDRDSVNKTDIVEHWIRGKGAIRLLLPARSADFNPIENLFYLLKKKITQMKAEKTREGNILKSQKAFFEIDDSILNSLCESFTRRLQKAIDLLGANTKY